MLKRLRNAFVPILVVVTVAALLPAPASAATQPRLGSTTSFAVLAGSTITNTGPTVLKGDLGLDPGSAVTGFPPGTVSGTKQIKNAVSLQAKKDLVIAYNDAAAAGPAATLTGDLGGRTLTPGVYRYASSALLTGTLVLNGNGVYIFQVASALTTATGSSVSLTNGAQACAVYWQVGSSATLGGGSRLVGSLLALESITMVTGATVLNGRALARNSAVTLDTNQITAPTGACSAPSGPSASPSASPSVSPSTLPQIGNLGGPGAPSLPWVPMLIAGAITAVLVGLRIRHGVRGS